MDGVINVYKPSGLTSFDVVYKVRKSLDIKRAGHTGTLDPAADGVLPVCVGKATKAAGLIMAAEKEYRAEIIFGFETDTQDSTGTVTNSTDKRIGEREFLEVINHFIGEINQVPPMYSAVHHKGQRLYKLAREGIEVERKPRNVKIYDIAVEDFSEDKATIKVRCSKGTYIRTLCEDIGRKAGCMAHMGALTRTKNGIFRIEDSVKIEEISPERLIPVDRLFGKYEKIILSEDNEKRVLNGVPLKMKCTDKKVYRLYGKNGNFLCLSQGTGGGTVLKMIKSFY